jgi:hypothetical protein
MRGCIPRPMSVAAGAGASLDELRGLTVEPTATG